jgi:hypothetical protein
LIAALGLALVTSSSARAQIPTVPLAGQVSYIGPGNVVSGATMWWGLRAYSAAIAAPGTNVAVNVRNTATAETCDVLIAATGNLGNVTACSGASSGLAFATFCALSAGTCAVVTFYDQIKGNACSSASCDVTQATAAQQSIVVFSCVNSHPCMETPAVSNANLVGANNFTPSASGGTIAFLGERVTGTASTNVLRSGTGSNRINAGTGANTWTLAAGGGAFTFTIGDAAFHSVIAVINGASSVANVDGTETTGTLTKSVVSSTPAFLNNLASSRLEGFEGGIWDTVAMSAGQRAALCKNMQAYNGLAGC